MRQNGSVTVVFSFVFVVMLSFILSFFELAAYTARSAYHASAALLATENYFAAYLEPLYECYHIFGREVPAGEDLVDWTECGIAEDVAYMTVKREGEKSLLLRSGAKYEVKDVSVLTENNLEGFYSQAVNAMKYRGVSEVANLLKEFAGMTEQTDAHLELATAKAATDSAYFEVDNKILHLMELIDGVDIAGYEKFMGGNKSTFQKEVYVKYFCVNPEAAADYFDRTEVYQAFLSNYENPCETLENLATCAETLANDIEQREYEEVLCRSAQAKLRGQKAVVDSELEKLEQSRTEAVSEYEEVLRELELLLEKGKDQKRIESLMAREEELKESLNSLKEEIAQYKTTEKELKKQEGQLEKTQKELEQRASEQHKRASGLAKEEEAFVERCKAIVDICNEAYIYAEEIRQELIKAKKVKAECENVLVSLQTVIGDEATQEYRAELKEYSFYEQAEGYEFDRMKQTLLENKSRLWNIRKQITTTDCRSLRTAAESLRKEIEVVGNYSFEGLRMDYGELSLEENLYEGVEELISKEVTNGLLGFLTEEEISEKCLDLTDLPSGLRCEKEERNIFSMLGTDMSGVLAELRAFLPEDLSVETMAERVTDSILFHSYLATHFSDFSDESNGNALSYELEYLISGKETDRDNLSAVVMRICAVRTIMHFVSLYTDGERKGVAEQAALAACGIIGLPALKAIVTFLLLFVWALEEAIIDTAALLQGKCVLLYPGKTGGNLAFHEIILFSKSLVSTRVKQMTEKKGLTMGYNEFLHLFLLLTSQENKKYRAADLIQENLRITYRESFRIKRCVWKVSYVTDGKSYVYSYE